MIADCQSPIRNLESGAGYGVCKTLIMGSNPIDASDNCGLQIDGFGSSIDNPLFINDILLSKDKDLHDPKHGFPSTRD
jgi:hypothetical protein